jgi:hypothetical protein
VVSANAKIGVYCGSAARRRKSAILLAVEWLVAVNLPKRLSLWGAALAGGFSRWRDASSCKIQG